MGILRGAVSTLPLRGAVAGVDEDLAVSDIEAGEMEEHLRGLGYIE